MPDAPCWICSVTPASLSPRYWEARCTCGDALAGHALRHPHPREDNACAGFRVQLGTREPPEPDTDTPPSLLNAEETRIP
jgi:hypothetical protein